VLGRSHVHVFGLAGAFLRLVANDMPIMIPGTLTSSRRDNWFRQVELWIDGTGALRDRSLAATAGSAPIHCRNRPQVS
jgi:hypothetical protein